VTNPMGVKGAGEAGCVGAMPALMNAIVDALRPLNVTTFDMPATPELWDNTLATEGTPPTYSNQVGRYTRIGDLVHIQGRVSVSSLGGLTLTETLRIGGLPFTAENITNSYSALSVARGRGLAISAGNTISGWFRLNTSYIELEQWDAIGGSTVMLVSEFSATGDIMFSATYKA